MISATIAGAVAGSALGELGNVAGDRAAQVASIAGTCVGAVALLDIAVAKVPLIQRDRETPRQLLYAGPLRWGAFTGAMLGFGALTRLGFVAWYLVPVIAFDAHSPVSGAVTWSAYGLVRTATPQVMEQARRSTRGRIRLRQRVLLTTGRTWARYATDCMSIALAAAIWLTAAR